MLVDEEVCWVVKAIFTMSAQGMSTTEIAKRLNEQGIPCPVEYKKVKGISYSKKLAEEKAVWIQSTVRKIIRDERYTGKMVSNVRSSAEVGKNVMNNNPNGLSLRAHMRELWMRRCSRRQILLCLRG